MTSLLTTVDGIVDCHTHSPSWRHASWLTGAPFTASDFLGFMDSAGIGAAVVLGHDGLYDATPETNDELARFVAADPARMVGMGMVNPRRAGAAEETERCLTDLGLRGLKLHPWLQGVSLHEGCLDPIGEVLAHHEAVLLCHDGTPPYSTAGQIAAFARRHPGVKVVLGHGGLHDTWREAIAAVQDTDNLWICMCGTPPYAGLQIVTQCPPGRVLFGSDAGLSDQAGQAYAVARVRELEQWGLSVEQLDAVLRVNPRALFGHAA